MTFHKKCEACIFHRIIFVLANLYSKDVGPWKLKWAPKLQNLGAHLAPKIFNKVSPLQVFGCSTGLGTGTNRGIMSCIFSSQNVGNF